MILAGDIGGTKTNLALYEEGNVRAGAFIATQTFRSHESKGLVEVIRRFCAAHKAPIQHAGFGVAGPVVNGRCTATNLPWVVDASELATELKLRRVSLVNDLVANAHGIGVLAAEDFLTLNTGAVDSIGTCAIISAGTGLGEAGMYWDGKKHHPFATEGGHADFAPNSEIEDALMEFLRTKYGHVSTERVVSGMGIVSIYEFLRDTNREEAPAWLRDAIKAGDAAAVISQAAMEHRAPICEETMQVFVSAYGAEAGNLALRILATGGVYVGGGIAPKILPILKEKTFISSFAQKGRMKDLVMSMPVKVILNDRTALVGAAKAAVMGI